MSVPLIFYQKRQIGFKSEEAMGAGKTKHDRPLRVLLTNEAFHTEPSRYLYSHGACLTSGNVRND